MLHFRISSSYNQSASKTQNLKNRQSSHTNQQHEETIVRLHPSPRQYGDPDNGNPLQSPAFRSAEEELFKSGKFVYFSIKGFHLVHVSP